MSTASKTTAALVLQGLAGPSQPQTSFPSSDGELIEIVVPPRSDAVGKTLRQLRLRERSGLIGVALWRQGKPQRTKVRDTPLIAESFGTDPLPCAVAVIVGASAGFLLPAGHPAPLLVQEPGGYRTVDYLRFGLGPILIVWAVIGLVITCIWPLTTTS